MVLMSPDKYHGGGGGGGRADIDHTANSTGEQCEGGMSSALLLSLS